MSDLHADSSFHKQSMKIDNYLKITEWIDSSIGQSTVIQELEKKDLNYPFEPNTKYTLSLKMILVLFVV